MDIKNKPQHVNSFFAEERKQKIIELLKNKQKIVIPELCEMFNTSPATIRNDLNKLQESGFLKRTHGGAILNKQVSYEHIFTREVKHTEQKKAFAQYAINLINDGDTIVLDTGTTTMELAKLMHTKKKLTIVLNDIQIASYLENTCDANLVFIGGYLRKGLHCTVGPLASSMLHNLNVDKAFIATNGLTLEGASTPDMYQADIKQAMIRIANHVILLADSSKLGTSAFQIFARLEDFEMLITDNGSDTDELAKLRERGIEIVSLPVE